MTIDDRYGGPRHVDRSAMRGKPTVTKTPEEIAAAFIKSADGYDEIAAKIAEMARDCRRNAQALASQSSPKTPPTKLERAAEAIRAEFDRKDGTPVGAARAAIEVLKRPTQEQLFAAWGYSSGLYGSAAEAYDKMLDFVLSESQEGK